MAVLVTGGRRTFGRLLLPRLIGTGHHPVVTSRSDSEPPPGAELRTLDFTEPYIDPSVLDGVHTVVHAASNPARTKRVDVQGTQRLLEAT